MLGGLVGEQRVEFNILLKWWYMFSFFLVPNYRLYDVASHQEADTSEKKTWYIKTWNSNAHPGYFILSGKAWSYGIISSFKQWWLLNIQVCNKNGKCDRAVFLTSTRQSALFGNLLDFSNLVHSTSTGSSISFVSSSPFSSKPWSISGAFIASSSALATSCVLPAAWLSSLFAPVFRENCTARFISASKAGMLWAQVKINKSNTKRSINGTRFVEKMLSLCHRLKFIKERCHWMFRLRSVSVWKPAKDWDVGSWQGTKMY